MLEAMDTAIGKYDIGKLMSGLDPLPAPEQNDAADFFGGSLIGYDPKQGTSLANTATGSTTWTKAQRDQFRDAWMGTSPGTDLSSFIKTNPTSAPWANQFIVQGDKTRLPGVGSDTPEWLDLIYDYGGKSTPSWTDFGDRTGGTTPQGWTSNPYALSASGDSILRGINLPPWMTGMTIGDGTTPSYGYNPDGTVNNYPSGTTGVPGGGALPAPAGVPIDVLRLRQQLEQWLGQNFQPQLNPYQGNLNLQSPFELSQAMNLAQRAGNSDQYDPYSSLASSLYNRTAAIDTPDFNKFLSPIREQGMLDLQDQLAQIKEQFAAGGLGRSSDIAEALSRGASRGIATINKDQSNLISQLYNEQLNRRIQAAQGINQIGSTVAGQRLGASSILQGLGQEDLRIQESNMQRQYNEWLRTQPQGYLNQALSFATNYPPLQQQYPQGMSTGAYIGGQLAGTAANIGGMAILGSLFPALFSSRKLKEDIKPVGEVSKRLAKLGIYNWKYKGDTQSHIGPMAEDFQEIFGVGDGVTIAFSDILGVMLASQKELLSARS